MNLLHPSRSLHCLLLAFTVLAVPTIASCSRSAQPDAEGASGDKSLAPADDSATVAETLVAEPAATEISGIRIAAADATVPIAPTSPSRHPRTVAIRAPKPSTNRTAPAKPSTENKTNNSAAPARLATIGKRQSPATLDDPKSEGWVSEAFSNDAMGQLKRLSKVLATPCDPDRKALAGLVADNFECAALRQGKLTAEFHDATFHVQRTSATGGGDEPVAHRGPDGLGAAFRELLEKYDSLKPLRVSFKVVGVELGDEFATTRALFESSGAASDGVLQQNATLEIRWNRPLVSEQPQLVGLRVVDYAEAWASSDKSKPLFADCTSAVFASVPEFWPQLGKGIEHWRSRIYTQYEIQTEAWRGFAVGDVNGDERDDVYVCQPAGLPNRLYIQNADGTVRDASAASGLNWLDPSRSALFVDLDNDRDQDLIVTLAGDLLVLSNDGAGRFTPRNFLKFPHADPYSIAAADYDQDGDLDFYVCSYASAFNDSSLSLPTFDLTDGGRNILLRNDSKWVFTDVTEETGLGVNNNRWSFAASWEDYDNDGDVDLYVANDYGANNLYRNDLGKFTDVTEKSGMEDRAFGMSVSWGDYDNDGWMDLYVSNMFSTAGNRITFQKDFQANAGEDVRRVFQRMARGNSLFRNKANGAFEDVSEPSGTTMGRWAWGSNFADLNNDGYEDLVVANGYVTNDDTADL